MTRFPRMTPRPFLKWAGGKGQLLPDLVERVAHAGDWRRYHEPFVGGGALFFELQRSGRLRHGATLSDTNPNLVEVWHVVQSDVDALIEVLRGHARACDEAYYYAVRGSVPTTPVERAARVIFLNKTGFNGLYRENSKGQFNVPFGRYASPAICDEPNLRACHGALQGIELVCAPFQAVLDRAAEGDLVYFDPPYVPVSLSSSFTKYAREGFDQADQVRLREVFATLGARGVKVLLSNSDTPLIEVLYRGYNFRTVMATRNVNRNAAGRGAIPEALVSTYAEDGSPWPAPPPPAVEELPKAAAGRTTRGRPKAR